MIFADCILLLFYLYIYIYAKQFPHEICSRRESIYLETTWQTSILAQEMTSSSLKQKKNVF